MKPKEMMIQEEMRISPETRLLVRKSNQKPVLLDCDGCFSDFVGTCLSLAKEKGVSVPEYETVKEDTRQYDWWKEANLDEEVAKPGFCSSIKLIDGGQDFIAKLRDNGYRVMFLTSPMKGSQYWYWERFKWLEKHFEIKRTDLIFATEKRYVNGLVFVDDHIGNILDWQEYQERPAILMKQPWNEKILNDCRLLSSGVKYDDTQVLFHNKKNSAVVRTNNWNDIFKMISLIKETEEKIHSTQTQKSAS